jgi:hypothetical protein
MLTLAGAENMTVVFVIPMIRIIVGVRRVNNKEKARLRGSLAIKKFCSG